MNLEKNINAIGGTKSEKVIVDNIFDLSKTMSVDSINKTLPSNTYQKNNQKNIITNEEQEQLLEDYEEVRRESWETLPVGIHIRYLRKDGTFRRGGYVISVVNVMSGVNKNNKMIQLSSNKSPYAKSWSTNLEHVQKIWKTKLNSDDGVNRINESVSKETKESIEYLTKNMDQIKIEIAKINNEQQRIVNLIKKLHNIKSKQPRHNN
jgi:hypothetical protein